jgi:hypothetical protein
LGKPQLRSIGSQFGIIHVKQGDQYARDYDGDDPRDQGFNQGESGLARHFTAVSRLIKETLLDPFSVQVTVEVTR